MNPIRIIAMSAPNGIHFQNVGKTTSGDKINPSIAAAMCSGMPNLWWSAARLKWASDTTSIELLYHELHKYAKSLKKRENWNIKKEHDRLEKMVLLALFEICHPNKYRKDKTKCEFLEMSPSVFSSRWKKRYDMIYRQIEDWSSSAINYIYKINSMV
ncbi:MAG: hypothetical protein AB2563_09625 [Candidatus Thiodiazotropha endolucinida]